jgi:hypothetical protein
MKLLPPRLEKIRYSTVCNAASMKSQPLHLS